MRLPINVAIAKAKNRADQNKVLCGFYAIISFFAMILSVIYPRAIPIFIVNLVLVVLFEIEFRYWCIQYVYLQNRGK